MPDDSAPKPVNPPGTPSILDRMKGFVFGSDTLSKAASGAGPAPAKSTVTPTEKITDDLAKRNEDYMTQKKAAAEKAEPKALPKVAPKAALKMTSPKGGKR